MRILIIKLGYSETLVAEVGKYVSLGDVLRTTPVVSALKEKYVNSHISWLVSKEAELLVLNNDDIDRVLVWDESMCCQLSTERFDLVINLEKVPEICVFSDKIEANKKQGFRFNYETGNYDGCKLGLNMIDYINQKERGIISKNCWQKSLIELLGLKWNNQNYSLGYKSASKKIFDIGLNFKVGKKWPQKAMPIQKWNMLSDKLDNMNYSYSWQKGLKNIYEYIDWINSCKVIITQDSLGLHLALALNKKVIALFGPTSSNEVCFPNNSIVINANNQNMNNIDLDEIIKECTIS